MVQQLVSNYLRLLYSKNTWSDRLLKFSGIVSFSPSCPYATRAFRVLSSFSSFVPGHMIFSEHDIL